MARPSGSGNRQSRDTSQLQGAIDKLRLSNEEQLGQANEYSEAIASNTRTTAELIDNMLEGMDLARQRDQDRDESGGGRPTPVPSGLGTVGGTPPVESGEEQLSAGSKFAKKFKGIGGRIAATFQGIGKGVAFAGAGIAVAGLGISLVLKEIRMLVTSFDEMAAGLEDINQLELDPKVFDQVGAAIGSLVKDLSIGNAIGLRILTGTAFNDLGDGLERLNNLQFKPEGIENLGKTLAALNNNTGILDSAGVKLLGSVNFTAISEGIERLNVVAQNVSPEEFEKIGQAIDNLLSPLSAGDLGEGAVLSLVADNISPEFADSIRLLGQLDIPKNFEDNMEAIGNGLNSLISPFGLFDTDNILILGSLKNSLPAVTEGVNGFTTDGATFNANATLVGQGLQNLLDGTDDLLGATGLQAIDDNIIPLAQGVQKFTGIVDDAMAQSWKTTSSIVGQGFQDLLDGTDDLFGATGLQMVDDNIIPLAEGVKKFTDIVDDEMATSFGKQGKLIGQGFQGLLDGTDDLFGTTGLQAIDDNLLPFANGVAAIDKAGRDLQLKNFQQIGKAIDEVEILSDRLKDMDFEPLEDVELPVRNLHAFTKDLQTLMQGIADGGNRKFESLGYAGAFDELEFGVGLLNVDLKTDSVLEQVRKIKSAISKVVMIEEIPATPPLVEDPPAVVGTEENTVGVLKPPEPVEATDENTVGILKPNDAEIEIIPKAGLFRVDPSMTAEKLAEAFNINTDLKMEQQGSNGTTVVAPSTQVTNNNSSQGVIMDQNQLPFDHLDASWPD